MNYPKLRLIQSDLAMHKLTMLRDRSVERARFRKIMRELSMMVCVDATKDLPTKLHNAETTGSVKFTGHVVQEDKITAISILRTGLVMEEAFMDLLPFAKFGHIGLYHDYDVGKISNYMAFMPPASTDDVFFIMDGLIGTGDSIRYVADGLLKSGVTSDQIRVLSLTASQIGLENIYSREEYQGMEIFTVDVESGVRPGPVNEKGQYPAFTLEHIADRLFGTSARPNP